MFEAPVTDDHERLVTWLICSVPATRSGGADKARQGIAE